MPRKLKVYQTSQGFYDLALAAPSMKAALKAWGSTMNVFAQGLAREATDGDVIEAAMASPGVVLKRPVGSRKPFAENAELPSASSLVVASGKSKKHAKPKKPVKAENKVDSASARRAAASYAREEAKREAQQRKEAAAAAKAEKRQADAIAKAQAAFDDAEAEHERTIAKLAKVVAAARARVDAEEKRWAVQRTRFQKQLRNAGK